MSIWRGDPTIKDLQQFHDKAMSGHLGIVFTEIGADFLRGTMPVNERTRQPFGVLHGGASVAFAETLASSAAYLCIDGEQHACFGQEINANHIRSVKAGLLTGTTRPFHIGARSHVWGIEIVDESGRLVCVSRITMAVVERIRT